jgi:hypothetical protein
MDEDSTNLRLVTEEREQLRGEVESLTSQRAELFKALDTANLEKGQLANDRRMFHERNSQLRVVLESVEWVSGKCPSCKGSKPEHQPGCEIANALKAVRTAASECICADCLNEIAHSSTPFCLPIRWNSNCVRDGCRMRSGHRCKQEQFKDEPQDPLPRA